MLGSKKDQQSFQIRDGNFEDAYTFVETLLTRRDINTQTASESLLVFEALMQELIDWGLDESMTLDISGTDKLGDLSIKIGFEGKVFTPYVDGENSIEDRILRAHDDKLDFSYRSGYNVINISVSRTYHTSLLACAVATALAIGIYIPMHMQASPEWEANLLNNYIFPLEKLFTNAMLMVGAPMTFFSLLKNLTDTYVISQRGSGLQRLQSKTLLTSILAIALAFVAAFLYGFPFAHMRESASLIGGSIDRSFYDVVVSLMPPSIFEPFESISPVPLMGVALLVTYALCSTGKHFDTLRQGMMACYALFSRMLRVVMAGLPLFCFIAIMDVLLDSGLSVIIEIAGFLIAINLSVVLLFISYAIRLRARGIAVKPFVKKLIPLLHENVKIGSAINATPYNIRYCAKNYKMDRTLLERNMPVLAQINLDGNCFIIMLFALGFLFTRNMNVSWLGLIGIALLILLLSLGAPNQPGSILIGTLIVTMYLNSYDMLCAAICSEAFLGSAQNIVNVIGDIVAAAIEDETTKSKA